MKLFLAFAFFASVYARREASVTVNSDGTYSISKSINKNADAYGYFEDTLNETGWGNLEVVVKVQPNTFATDYQRAYAGGIVEGYLTSNRIYENWISLRKAVNWDYTKGPSKKLASWLSEQDEWMTQQIDRNRKDPFWQYANILVGQIEGLQYGYNQTANEYGYAQLGSFPFQFLNLVGDLLDLESVLDPEKRVDMYNMNEEEYLRYHLHHGRCSALVKVTPTLDNLFIGHSSWFTYQAMNRIMKRYNFQFSDVDTPGRQMVFSSYPGFLESLDDFYIMGSGLAMLQTTNEVPDTSLYNQCSPQSLFAWQRVRIANALANTGNEWYQYLARQNSGTYNNQYMVINTNLFTQGEPLKDNTLWVVEQIPGLVYGEDKTDVLERGYWGSYNVPALEKIYNQSGYPELVKRVGVTASYDLAPRARIFRRDANDVKDLDTFKSFMRYNDYRQDSIENDNPMWAICSRGDLERIDPAPSGCYDSKGANITMIRQMQVTAINGPTYDDLPPFDWEAFPTVPHYGQPSKFKFDWNFYQAKLD